MLRNAVSFRGNLPPTTSRGFLSHSPMKIFKYSLLMYGANCRASSNLMQWTYASLRSFTPYCPRFHTPSHRLLSIENTCTTLARDGSSRISLISEFSCTVLPSRILGVRRCGWTYVASLHVHLTLRTKRCSESVVASLLHLLLPCLPGTLGG